MFMKQDWFMRQIEIIAVAIARLAFGKGEISYEMPSEERDRAGDPPYAQEAMALLKQGRLGEAEDALFGGLNPANREGLLFATDFYREANRLSDEELAAQNFTREELWDGLHEIMVLCGVDIPGL